jgi:SAM-dependent MidA family methyltransferase
MSWIVEEIAQRGGQVSFRDYMTLALYHPVHGYYSSSDTPRYGRSADYLTAPSASAWYPRILAGLLSDIAADVGPLQLIDLGAGDGSCVAGIVDSLGSDAGGVLSGIVTVERSPAMLRLQRHRLRDLGLPIQVTDQIAMLETSGQPTFVHASELYDAIPVHRVVMGRDGLCEMWVEAGSDGLAWKHVDARREIRGYFEKHGVTLQPGQIAELSLEWQSGHRDLLRRLPGDAAVLVLEYGYPASRLFNARGRAGGSLSCYRGHRLSRDPLIDPGEWDITAHVNIGDLRSAAAVEGWAEIGWWPLAEFLVRAGIEGAMHRLGVGEEAELTADTVTHRQEIKRLLDPDGMGSDLRMLVQARGAMLDALRKVLKL